ncbi:uncharacterized protein LOC144638433 isoform X2 [Oculina patagonica]
MAAKGVFCVLFVCFFALGSATYCTGDGDCTTWGESCCPDNVCRQTCGYCSYDSECGTGEECCDGDCKIACPVNGGAIAGAIVGTIVFFAIIASIVACFFCACCPYYRYRSPGTVIVSQPPYQPFVSTTTHTTVATQQQYPPPGNYNQPPPPGYNQPPPPGYNQPPQPYPNYPPPQAQGQTPMPPPVGAGQPVKY